MTTDRRGFLHIFGISSAVVASGTEVTKEALAEVGPIVALDRRGLPRDLPYPQFPRYDVVREALYSKLEIPKNTMRKQHSVFDFVGYGGDPRKGLCDTNLDMPYTLAAPECFCVQRIGIVFSSTTEPKLRDVFAERFAFRFVMGQKAYLTAPIAHAMAVSDSYSTKLLFDISKLPLIITHGYHFRVDLLSERPLMPHGKIVLWAVLDGMRARGVQ